MKVEHLKVNEKIGFSRLVRDLPIGLYENDDWTFMKVGEGCKSIMFNTSIPTVVMFADDRTVVVAKKVGSKTTFIQDEN